MTKINKSVNKKRHGYHHNRNKRYHHVYLPYLPAILLIAASLVTLGLKPIHSTRGVLAYATEMSVSSLMSETNQRRSASGVASLTSNSKLNQAAQAKANDMVQRNYWSHNTPEGEEPWIFISQAGYKYSKAGENLAYGFDTSAATVAGWMNSSTHKANMLDAGFTEVGFGFTNAENFQGGGNETVVVAMYAKPQAAPAPVPAQSPSPENKQSQPSTLPQSTKPAAQSSTGQADPSQAEQATPATPTDDNATTMQAPPEKDEPQKSVSRVEAITDGQAPWAPFAVGLMSGTAVTVMLVNHGLRLRKLLRGSRRFILHHPILDLTMISLLAFALTLSQTIGVIL